jgi:ABC-type uncharacterized transport system substrate-binding protein
VVQVWYAIKRLALGFVLIVLASAVLLLSDRDRRTATAGTGAAASARVWRVAIVQHASTPVLDEGVQGMIAGLAERGFTDGDRIRLRTYNAQGDLATGNAIARQVTTGEFDLVLTSSTPSMQAVANANRAGRTRHVFGLVADPFSAGVGLDAARPLQHPRNMVGLGSFLPVDEAFALARRALPTLARVGVAWNPSEANSEAFTRKAREACRALGVTLLEANVESTSGVAEAVQSLASRGAQALFVGGDNTMLSAVDAAIAAARTARIPVFTIVPGAADRGTLFDVGLNFRELGRLTGQLAARVLGGVDPATLPIRDAQAEVPRRFIVNLLAARGLRERWTIPSETARAATVLVDEGGVHARTPPAAARPALARKWRLDLVQFNNVLDVEESEEGVMAGLREAGLVKGRDYVTTVRNAQGDMATVSGLIDAAIVERTDLLITFSTPTLQAALQRARNVPIVFNYLASAIAAGAGKSDTDHLPNVTGVYMSAAFDEMLTLIRGTLPSARTLGTLYVPAEVNTVFYKDRLQEETAKAGFELIAVPANTSSDVADAALALVSRRPDAICQIPGNLTASAFPSIAQAAQRARLPVFAFQTSQVRAGASLVVGRDYRDSGRQAALLAARVMRGESPASLPFQAVTRTRVIVNLEAARRIGLVIPRTIVEHAAEVVGK